MTNTTKEFIQKLTAICGSDYVKSGAGLEESLLTDWTHSVRGTALAAVFPANTAEVAQVLTLCHQQRVSVTIQGGNTGMSAGGIPAAAGDSNGIILALRRLNKIRAIDQQARTMTVEAGCILETLRQHAAAAQLFFPLSLGAKGSCQIGGNLATNAGGLNVLRYGSTRHLCLGIEAVLADGRIFSGLSGLHKNNSGYDLKELIIGSEGTLAVITAATLKLFPPPQNPVTAWVEVPSPQAALALMNLIQQHSNNALAAFEMLPAEIFKIIARHQPQTTLPHQNDIPTWTVLLETTDTDSEHVHALLMQALEEKLANNIQLATSETQRAMFWQVREEAPLILARHGKWLRHDIALPVAALPAFIAEVEQRLRAVCDGLYIIGFGHLGDGNLHLSVRPLDADPQEHPELSTQLSRAVYDCVAAYDGSFSAEHGIGQLKVELLERYKDPTALAMMQAIKQALDPHYLLNPGKVLKPLPTVSPAPLVR
ncbi:MAG: FAD-binding oxidoreductase [Proteobacteria bacterium]|nr:FAD-binding oxidoreductase [Pseudomonadota bacterium]